MDKNRWYRSIPKVDILLADETVQSLIAQYGRDPVMEAIRSETDKLRAVIGRCDEDETAEKEVNLLVVRIESAVAQMYTPNMRTVINATGTILHTNLGRAPIAKSHMERAIGLVSRYSNLEYNLSEGRRGERYSHFEELLCKLTGAEAAMAVNNNAAAVMLILSSMAKGGEVIVSRGELVEVGGKFRIPDVMEQSGAVLVEVGTTNKTHFDDYEAAITEATKALLKVHTSNYRIVGFTESVAMEELIPLKEQYDVPVIEDLGSGVLIDLSKYGLTYEPTVQDSVRSGADVVCFSGDKLLGGPQAGIIIGKKKYIDMMKKNQLTRALRIDKFTAAALELVLQEYLNEEKAVCNIPTLSMITKSFQEVNEDAVCLKAVLEGAGLAAEIGTASCESQIGGGSLPLERIPSMAVTVKPREISVPVLEERLRKMPVPLIPRTVNDTILLDVRTMDKSMYTLLAEELVELNVLNKDCMI